MMARFLRVRDALEQSRRGIETAHTTEGRACSTSTASSGGRLVGGAARH